MTVFMFPGQGSQTKGMGRDIFDDYPSYVYQANEFLGYDIKQLCLSDPENKLNHTEYTQPALYTVCVLTYLEKRKAHMPKYIIGHSLGEYAGLFAAGCFDFITGLALVRKRGILMSRAINGSMLAIEGISIEGIKKILLNNQLDSIDIANHNAQKSIVISGPKNEILQAESLLTNKAKRSVILRVSGAFHSRYMQQAASLFHDYLNSFTFRKPEIPIIANFSAKPYQISNIKYNLVNQISNRVRWFESINHLIDLGENSFYEIGPGKVLTGILDRIKHTNESRTFTNRQADLSNLNTIEENIFKLLTDKIRDILPHVTISQIQPNNSLLNLGANSIDRAEIIMSTLAELKSHIPLIKFSVAKNIGDLVKVIYNNSPIS